MSPSDTFSYFIKEIFWVSTYKHVVRTCLKVDTPAGKKDEEFFFLAKDWEEIKKQGWFEDTKPISKDVAWHYECLSDDEFYSNLYSKKLSQFSDEEFIDEFNRRLNSSFHSIELVSKAQLKKG